MQLFKQILKVGVVKKQLDFLHLWKSSWPHTRLIFLLVEKIKFQQIKQLRFSVTGGLALGNWTLSLPRKHFAVAPGSGAILSQCKQDMTGVMETKGKFNFKHFNFKEQHF